MYKKFSLVSLFLLFPLVAIANTHKSETFNINSRSNDINIKSIELEKKLTKVNYSLTNLTDQYQVVYIFGEKSRWVLSKGISIDLDQSSFGPKQCAQTTLALTDISIFCTAKNSFTVFCRNSFANYLMDWLKDASFDCKYKFLKS